MVSRTPRRMGTKIVNVHSAAEETTLVSNQLRPLVILVATVSMAVATLLITTATLGASPINSMEVVAQLD
jgi:hypothetical protein